MRLAAELGASLRPGLRIVSSPRLRARQTAEVIASAVHDATIEADERWAETNFGIAEGLTFDELARVAPGIAARLAQGEVDIDWPGGESAASLAARVESAWVDLDESATTHARRVACRPAQNRHRPRHGPSGR